MYSFYSVIIFTLILLTSITASGQNSAEDLIEKKVEALRMSEDYQRTRDLDAQDKIVNPEEYFIGPGDELTIFFQGAYTRENRIVVTPEGSVLVPEFGEVYLGQITLMDAKQKILEALRERYRNVVISITLSKLRKLKVSVDGNVYFPGIFTVTSMDRVTEAVSMAGGLTDDGSKRNIRLFRNGEVINADLLLYSRGGDDKSNPYLLEGDKIFVTPKQTNIGLIEIYGSVKLAGKYEYVPGERISDLIKLAGGLKIDADLSSSELVRFAIGVDTSIVIKIDLEEILANPKSSADLVLQPDDRIFIRAYPDFHYKAQVTIIGEVFYPGVYPIQEDTTTLTEIIQQAGGFTRQASLDEAKMYRYGYEALKDTELERQLKLSVAELSDIEREYLLLRSDPEQGRISIDFKGLFIHDVIAFNVTLKDRDQIIIPRMSNTVRIMGRVIKPGLLSFKKDAGIDFYVQKAGGYTRSASKGEVRIIKGETGAILKPSSKVKIEIGDQILVPQKKDTDWWGLTKDIGLFLANLATVYIVIDQVVK
jgi:polysaccharide biosynthesis/export protein